MSNNIPASVKKYLEKYSLTKWKLEADKKMKITAAAVIPAIKEFENLKKLIRSLAENNGECLDRTLIIFVINNFASSDSEIKRENNETILFLRSKIGKQKINIGIVDASGRGNEMPEKEGGVGFARKIGMDLALNVFDYDQPGEKILISLDADCTVKKNYLTEIFNYYEDANSHAAVLRYRHDISGSNEQTAAIIFYEIYLRYYVLGLKYAGSKYAFHAIGSAMTCDLEAYIKAEGMNKRKAGEDFYFLQKLAKNTSIGKIYSTTVYPSSRSSLRVPFGTGVKIAQFRPAEENYLLYHPLTFRILKEWLLIFNNEYPDAEMYLKAAGDVNPELKEFLMSQGFKKDFTNILRNSAARMQLQKQKTGWFDGFKTLKLIHHLRDTVCPMKNMFEALDDFLELISYKDKPDYPGNKIPPLAVQRKYLEILRKLDDQ